MMIIIASILQFSSFKRLIGNSFDFFEVSYLQLHLNELNFVVKTVVVFLINTNKIRVLSEHWLEK